MNFITRIWLIITCFTLAILFVQITMVIDRFKERNPDAKIVGGSGSLMGKIECLLGIIMVSACPILHLFTISTALLCHEDIVTRAIEKVEERIGKKK